jgi:hypothetical protein
VSGLVGVPTVITASTKVKTISIECACNDSSYRTANYSRSEVRLHFWKLVANIWGVVSTAALHRLSPSNKKWIQLRTPLV